MKTSKNQRFLAPGKFKKFSQEPEVMKELHKIREEMSKMTKKEFHESLKKASEEFKSINR